MFVSLYAHTEGGEESELLGAGWQLGGRPTGTPLPPGITARHEGNRTEVCDGISGSERFLQTHGRLPSGQDADLHVHDDVAPLGVHVVQPAVSG
jgi:hypothetical protein